MHALRPECIRADRGCQRRVDPPGDAEHDLAEAVLLDVVPHAEAQRETHLLEPRLERRDGCGSGGSLCPRCGQLDDRDVRNALTCPLELPAAYVAQAPADRLSRIDVDDEECLLEARSAGDDSSFVVEDDGVTVEDELVLSTDEVAEGEIRRVVAGTRDEHLLPLLGLADVVRRGREVHDQLRTSEREIRRGRAGLPDVLADRRADEDVARV